MIALFNFTQAASGEDLPYGYYSPIYHYWTCGDGCCSDYRRVGFANGDQIGVFIDSSVEAPRFFEILYPSGEPMLREGEPLRMSAEDFMELLSNEILVEQTAREWLAKPLRG